MNQCEYRGHSPRTQGDFGAQGFGDRFVSVLVALGAVASLTGRGGNCFPELRSVNRPVNSERFHALDATRAFALLLGVVFHAAWSFIPSNLGTPITDVSGSVGFAYVFYASHIFRMPVFFLIAGFFARLMYHRRGPSAFAKNRFLRIVVPLVIGWIALIPVTILTWVWGSNRSGQNLTEVSLFRIFQVTGTGLIQIPKPNAGLFIFAHLWFLYYLLLMYAMLLCVDLFFIRRIKNDSPIWSGVDRFVAQCARSPWAFVALVPVTGLILGVMEGWLGSDTPARGITPNIVVLTLYGEFFGFGWLLHRQSYVLQNFVRYWRTRLAIGFALSVVLFGMYDRLANIGFASGSDDLYPLISPNQITDWSVFLTQLKSADRIPNSDRALLWQRIPESDQARISQLTSDASIDLQLGVCKSLNLLLGHPNLFRHDEQVAKGNRGLLELRPFNVEESKAARWQNRERLNLAFAETLVGNPLCLAWYWPVKLAYSLGYGLAMWCLVFATLGFFQEYCVHYSPAWRYIADSSYWIYLAHIPMVPWLQIWIAPTPWPGILKFLLLNFVSFGLLFLSYHVLVRSTFIGLILNGRRYPRGKIPWRKQSQGSAT